MNTVLILGSGPSALEAAEWPRSTFDYILAINNAWRVRLDWSHLIYPEDFPAERRPKQVLDSQREITAADFVGAQNRFGGFVFAGGTMAFTASYWALHELKPSAILYFGCDMVYPKATPSHFYGEGTADPLRPDVTLRSLEAKSCRFMAFAARQNCAVFNLSRGESRLCFPRMDVDDVSRSDLLPPDLDHHAFARIVEQEATAGYFVESGRYWEVEDTFDTGIIDSIDRQWLELFRFR